MNSINLLGRLTKDVEVRYTQSGKCVASLNLAVDRQFLGADGQRQTDFIPVILFGKTAEAAGNYVHKGQRLLVQGSLQIRSYEAKDGSKRWVAEVIGNHIEFIEKKEDSARSSGGFNDFGTPFNEEIPF